MNISQLEQLNKKLISNYNGNISKSRLIQLASFFELIINAKDKRINESYLFEHLPEYLALLKQIDLYGTNPDEYTRINEINDQLRLICKEFEIKVEIDSVCEDFDSRVKQFKELMKGNHKVVLPGFNFSVIERVDNSDTLYSNIINLSIKITRNKNLKADKVICIPSDSNADKKLIEQIRNSIDSAKKIVSEYQKKIDKFHEIIIEFSNSSITYEGDSLGIALTLAVAEQFLHIYKSRTLLSIKDNIAITGSLFKSGEIIEFPDNIIKIKAEAVFFSPCEIFIVPKKNETCAEDTINKLRATYPGKNLSIIGIESLEDLLDRRSVININNQNFIIWTAKRVAHQKAALALFFTLLLFIVYFFVYEFDSNPEKVGLSNEKLIIENKLGKVLWYKNVSLAPIMLKNNPLYSEQLARLIDINEDGDNEVILSIDISNRELEVKARKRIVCLDKNQNEIWEYRFRETISTTDETFSPIYSIKIIDDYKDEKGNHFIVCVGQHENYYPSPIFILNAKTGEKVSETFWHPGGGSSGFVEDIDNDGKLELICSSIANGWERMVLYSIELDKLNGTAPAPPRYQFIGLEVADFDYYLQLPKSDLNSYYGERFNIPAQQPGNIKDSKKIYFSLLEADVYSDQTASAISYSFEYDFKLREISIGDKFRISRDSLVAKGKIKGPFTETKEYHNTLRNQIKYWNGKKFVTINHLKTRSN